MKTFQVSKALTGLVAIALIGTLLGAMLGGNIQVVGASSAVVRFDPAGATISPNQTIAINVQIDNVTGLMGAEFHLSYNPAILEVQDANANTDGVQIANGSLLTDFVAQNHVDSTQGVIDFAVLQLPPHSAASGSGVLATITFVGKAAGTSALTFTTVNLAGDGGAVITADAQNSSVSVSSSGGATSTPVPGQPTSTPVPSYPTPTPIPGYPTATPVPGYPTATPAPSGGILGYHTVRARETLFCIGRAYSVLPWSIASQNGLSYPYYLRVGQVLAIPNVPWSSPVSNPVCQRQFGDSNPSPSPQPTVPPSSGCRATYVVQRGDTLFSIARRYSTTAWAIAVANNIANPNVIFPGQVLCIR